ncbi:MAG: hypothetical protein WD850_03240 [Candidatus Spechtbacterales bacterium]
MKSLLFLLFIVSIAVGAGAVLLDAIAPQLGLRFPQEESLPREGGLYIFAQGSQDWARATVDGGDVKNLLVHDMAFVPQVDGSVILLAGLDGVYQSSDRGLRWTKVFKETFKGRVEAFVVDTRTPAPAIYASGLSENGESVVVKSPDGGATFQQILTAGPASKRVVGLALDRFSREKIYALTSDGIFLVSNDSGRSWSSEQIGGGSFVKLLMHPSDPSMLFALTRAGTFYKSTNSGATWRNMEPVLTVNTTAPARVYSVAFASSGGTLYVGTDQGLLRSRNSGESFERIELLLASQRVVTAVAVDPQRSGTIYVGAGQQLLRTTDEGATWQVSSGAIGAGWIGSLTVHPLDSDLVYIGILSS